MTKYIPNTVTLLSSFFGMLATAFAFQGNLHYAGYCILLAAFCDFADGLLARLLNAKSALGADLDSLSDLVSFGVAPAAIAYQLVYTILSEQLSFLAYTSFLIVPFSALRLAIFNNSTNQTTSFVGVSKLPLFSLKGNFIKDKSMWLFFTISLISLLIFHLGGLFFIILLYVLSGILGLFFRKNKL